MPRVQRALSIEDLNRRFKHEESPQHESTRSPGSWPEPRQARLSARLPDPPVFNGTNTHVQYNEWKIRIQDKLIHNADHYPSNDFQIAYIISRLGGEAIQYAIPKQYRSVTELLDRLSDIYEVPVQIIKQANRTAFNQLQQDNDEPFPVFYKKFMKHGSDRYSNKTNLSLLEEDLREKINPRLQWVLACNPRDTSLPELKEYLLLVDYYQRSEAQALIDQKAILFAQQYAKARYELANKKQIRILQRYQQSDSDDYEF